MRLAVLTLGVVAVGVGLALAVLFGLQQVSCETQYCTSSGGETCDSGVACPSPVQLGLGIAGVVGGLVLAVIGVRSKSADQITAEVLARKS